MIHPTYETLVNYLENQLPEIDRAQVEEHLSGSCQQCSGKLAKLRTVLELTLSDRTFAPSAAVLKQAVTLLPQRLTHVSNPLLRVFAQLQFDSRLQLSRTAVRGPKTSQSRQMLFSAQQVDIDLQITPERGEHHLVGQILSSDQRAGQMAAFVSLHNKSGELLKGTETDALGQFTFKQIPAGVYNLDFDLGSQEVAILDLEFSNDH